MSTHHLRGTAWMKFLKGLSLFILGLLLFLSLIIFGVAFTVNSTVLNPDFVVSQVDNLDVTYLATDAINEQIAKGDIPEEFGEALVNTLIKFEPMVKEQVNTATHSVYYYLLGEKPDPELALTLKNTILSTEFINSLVDELDIASLAGKLIHEKISE